MPKQKLVEMREQLKRTMINLIRNSIQANAIKINLYTKEVDDKLELFVEDNGNWNFRRKS